MTPEEKEELKFIVKEAADEKIREFWIDRETHFRHHEFIDSWMRWSDRVSSVAVQTVVGSVIVFMIGLLALGFAIFGFKK